MLDFFKEWISSAQSTAIDRVKNPILGAFSLSWCAFNWDKILILFFSTHPIEEKIFLIKSGINDDIIFIYPALSAALIVSTLPILSVVVAFLQNKPMRISIDLQTDRSDHRLSRKIKSEALRAEGDIAYERVKTGEQLNIQNMRSEIAKSKEDASEMQGKLDVMYKHLLEVQERLEETEANLESERMESAKINEELKRTYELLSVYNHENRLSGEPKASNELSDAILESFRSIR